MIISRDLYLNRLIAHRHNGLIKIITGIRRCGKSFLLFNLFKNFLLDDGVNPAHIIEIALDDRRNKALRDPDNCLKFVLDKVTNSKEQFYLLIDEVQYMPEFEDVLNSFLHVANLDTYVTGSNSKFLSSDIITEFRGRGDELRVHPLTFKEFTKTVPDLRFDDAFNYYQTYGGLPYTALLSNEEEKGSYLKRLFDEVYLKDIIERNKIRNNLQVEILLNVIASSIGSLTNPQRLENTFKSSGDKHISAVTINQYLNYFIDAFLIEKAERFDVKGKKYISTPQKYYFSDIGLRNARLNFRQQETTHIMENIIYNELRARNYSVDVGVVEINERQESGHYVRKQTEIDFIASKGSQKYYIQSALSLDLETKLQQEIRPLTNTGDSFKKIVVVKDNILPSRDENGILTLGLKQFLTEPNCINL